VAGIEYYRQVFPQVPIVGVVPVVKTAALHSKKKNFVVLSTEFTAGSEYQKMLIKQWAGGCSVANVGSASLVPLIEKGKTEGREVEEELHRLLDPLKGTSYDVIALGCTHYPFIKATLQKIIGEGVEILDSGDAIARQVQKILQTNDIASTENGGIKFLSTGESLAVSDVFQKLLAQQVEVSHVAI
jgi:glutamate racemase